MLTNKLNLTFKKKILTTALLTSCCFNAFCNPTFQFKVEYDSSIGTYGATLIKCTSNDASINIPNTHNENGIPCPVTRIGNNVFANNKSLCNVTLPSQLEHIGQSAFKGCSNLHTVDASTSNKVRSVAENAFMDCPQLASIAVKSKNPLEIKTNAFTNCTSLETVLFEGGMNLPQLPSDMNIQDSVFTNCRKLLSVSFRVVKPNAQVTSRISCNRSFVNCSSLNSIMFQADQLKYYLRIVKGDNSVKSLTIPTDLICTMNIAPGAAFDDCHSLQTITVTGPRPEDQNPELINRLFENPKLDNITLYYPTTWLSLATPNLPIPWDLFQNKIGYQANKTSRILTNNNAYSIFPVNNVKELSTATPDSTVALHFSGKTFTKSVASPK